MINFVDLLFNDLEYAIFSNMLLNFIHPQQLYNSFINHASKKVIGWLLNKNFTVISNVTI